VLDRSAGCGFTSAEFFPKCRTVVFGTNSAMADIEARLEPEFSRRGWTTAQGLAWFSAASPDNDVCILYVPLTREDALTEAEPHGGPVGERWSRYSATVDVVLDDCVDHS
jgi:hypothetical protein